MWALDPITKRRFARFRKIKRGYYSLLILTAAIVLSIFAPFLAESRAIAVWYDGRLYLLDLASGREVWSYTIGDALAASPAVAAGRIVIGSADGALYCFGQAPASP